MNREELLAALKPITDGLFGKQGLRRYERPQFTLRPLASMLRDLMAIEPEEWYAYAFSREPLNGKLDETLRRRWMYQAWHCGAEYADKTAQLYGSRDARHIAEAMGMQVQYPRLPERTDRVLFAEFRVPNHINIFMDAVERADKLRQRPELAGVLPGGLDIPAVLLAHELFHHVEEQYKKEIFTQTEKLRLWKLGPIHNDSRLIALSEIAAMGFTHRLNGLSFSPYVLDMFLVYSYSPQEACGLYEEMMDFAARPCCEPETDERLS